MVGNTTTIIDSPCFPYASSINAHIRVCVCLFPFMVILASISISTTIWSILNDWVVPYPQQLELICLHFHSANRIQIKIN